MNITAEKYYDDNLENYNLLNKIDPMTAKQAMEMMEGYHQANLKLLGIGVVVRSVFTIHSTEDESIIKIVGTEEEAKQEVLKFAEEHKYADFFYEKQTL